MDKNKLKKKTNILITVFFTLTLLFICSMPFLAVNTQPSLPIGIYVKSYDRNYKKGDIVVFKLDEQYDKFYNKKKNLLSMKKIQATNKDKIIFKNEQIYVNDENFGEVHNIGIKSAGNEIDENCFFVLSRSKNSFDSRYYGQVCKKDILYKARLIYRWKGNHYER